ncbi:hypothetical protein AM503_17865 [Klebsiella michiganensis]
MFFVWLFYYFFFFKQKTAFGFGVRLVGSGMCIRNKCIIVLFHFFFCKVKIRLNIAFVLICKICPCRKEPDDAVFSVSWGIFRRLNHNASHPCKVNNRRG